MKGTLTLPLSQRSREWSWPTFRPDQIVFGIVALVLLLVVVPPVVTLIQTSLLVGAGPGRAGTLSVESYTAILQSPEFPGLVGTTLVFAFGSCAVGLVLGGMLAWLTERTNAPFKQLVYAASFVSFAVPGILRAVGWIFLLGPRTGTLNELFRGAFHTDRTLVDVFTMPAMIVIEGTFWIPVVFLMLGASFRAMDPALEEAAIMSGSSTPQTVRRITLRLVLPALLSALLLMFIRGIQAFEVPLVLGVPSKIYVLTTEVFISMQARVIPEYSRPAAYGVLLFGFLLVCVYFYAKATGRTSRFVTVTGKGFRPRQLDLGHGRILAGALILLVVAIQFLPILELVAASFLRSLGNAQLTFGNYTLVLSSPAILQSLVNSFVIAAVSATVVVLVAAVVAWCIVRGQMAIRGLLDQLASLPLVFSGVVLGLAVLILYVRSPIPVYGTIWILVIAYVTAFLPFGLRYAHPGLLQIAPELEECGQTSGARWGQVFRKIVIPLLVPALFAAWVFVFLISLRELSAAALLYTAQSPVIATKMLDLWQNGNVNQVSAFGAIVSALSITFAIGAYRFIRRWGLRAG
ncbi:MAG TPA: iron ABC transporter permease [Chloroflexota bacterium]